jgi:transcription termination/antitermination protein NusA
MKVTLNEESIQTINFFQKLTGASVLDSIIEEDTIYFVVKKGQYGMAVGKSGERIKRAENMFKKKIRILEHGDTMEEFVKNAIREAKKIEIKGDAIQISLSGRDRAKVLGKGGEKVKILNRFIEHLYEKKTVKILAPIRL